MISHRYIPALCAGFLLLGGCQALPSSDHALTHAPTTSAVIDILHYSAWVEPDIGTKSVTGWVEVTFTNANAANKELKLNAGALEIDSISEEGKPLAYLRAGNTLTIALPVSTGQTGYSQRRTVKIAYHGQPKQGITFLTDAKQVFTVFSTSQWMPCADAPDERATLQLTLVVPAGMKVAANGKPISERMSPQGKLISEWSEELPVSSYLYGFVAGDFRDARDDSAKPALRFLGPPAFSENDLRQIFRDTREMIRFYEDKAGMAYPGPTYTQALVSGRAAQEMSGLAVMSENYGKRVLTDERKTWLGAHELSHQWWGNGVTNRDWTHFWLNEGIATFMNAAWFEHRYGREEYLLHIDGAKASYEKLKAAGKDKPLVFPNWDNPTPEDRSLVYDKGAYVVHLLREKLGEKAFWAGLRRYTREYWGKPVTTRDFQRVMEAESGTDLSDFFGERIYPRD